MHQTYRCQLLVTAACLAVMLSGCGGGSNTRMDSSTGMPGGTEPDVGDMGVRVETETYRQGRTDDGTIPLRWDIYSPESAGGCDTCLLPGILLIHGGSYIEGSREDADIVETAKALAKNGYAVATIDYRKLGDNPVPGPVFTDAAQFPKLADFIDEIEDRGELDYGWDVLEPAVLAAHEDALEALRKLYADAAKYRIDPERLVAIGGSAGAVTALNLAYTLDGSTSVPSLIAVGDIVGAAPDATIKAGDAALFIAHSRDDDVVPFEEAEELERKAMAAGIPVEFIRLDGVGHDVDVMQPHTESGESILDRLLAFLEDNLGPSGRGIGIGVVGGQGVAVLLAVFDTGSSDGGESVPAEHGGQSHTASDLVASSPVSPVGLRFGRTSEQRVRDGRVEYWSRTFSGNTAPALTGGAKTAAQGYAIGAKLNVGDGVRLGVSAIPNVAVSSRGESALDGATSLQGGRYTVHGDWNGTALSVRASFSHGDYQAQSRFERRAGVDALSGTSGLNRNHASLGIRVRLGVGTLRAMPSVSWFAGSATRSAYTAENDTWLVDVPETATRYRGWKAGLSFAPMAWRTGPRGLRWLPTVNLSTQRTLTGTPGDVRLLYSDRVTGTYRFADEARQAQLPGTVSAISVGVTANGGNSDRWKVRVGYVGAVIDSAPDHALTTQLHVRF